MPRYAHIPMNAAMAINARISTSLLRIGVIEPFYFTAEDVVNSAIRVKLIIFVHYTIPNSFNRACAFALNSLKLPSFLITLSTATVSTAVSDV